MRVYTLRGLCYNKVSNCRWIEHIWCKTCDTAQIIFFNILYSEKWPQMVMRKPNKPKKIINIFAFLCEKGFPIRICKSYEKFWYWCERLVYKSAISLTYLGFLLFFRHLMHRKQIYPQKKNYGLLEYIKMIWASSFHRAFIELIKKMFNHNTQWNIVILHFLCD